VPPLGFRQYQATDLSAWKGRASDPKFQAVVTAIQKLRVAAQRRHLSWRCPLPRQSPAAPAAAR
jgi:hypothetical protein